MPRLAHPALQPALGEHFPEGLLRLTYAGGGDAAPDWALLRPGARRDLWIVVLHGHGAQGDQLFTRRDVRDLWLPAFLATGAGLLTPNLRGNAWMGPAAAADLHALLEYLRAEFGLRRTLFCSGSMGGTGNLLYGALHPEDVGGIVARGAASDLATYWRWCRSQTGPDILRQIADAIQNAYGGTPDEAPAAYRRHDALRQAARLSMPVYLAHGGADAVIPVEQSRRLAERLCGKPDFCYREIPGGNHDSPLYDGCGLDWVLQRMS